MNRLKKLYDLERDLRDLMSKANSRTYAPLAKQYRETLREIEEIEGMGKGDDEIEEILNGRDNGQSRTVRPDRSKLHRE